jgi:putative transposase
MLAMKQTLVIRLETNAAQRQTLLATLEAFNRACQHVADVAYDNRLANKIALQPLVYNDLRNRYGLSSQMAVRAISKACEAYKPDKRIHVRIPAHDPMILDQRLLSFKGLTHVSILCLPGRQLIPFRFVSYAGPRHDRIAGHADLIYEDDNFLLHVCIDMPTPPPGVPPGPDEVPFLELAIPVFEGGPDEESDLLPEDDLLQDVEMLLDEEGLLDD